LLPTALNRNASCAIRRRTLKAETITGSARWAETNAVWRGHTQKLDNLAKALRLRGKGRAAIGGAHSERPTVPRITFASWI